MTRAILTAIAALCGLALLAPGVAAQQSPAPKSSGAAKSDIVVPLQQRNASGVSGTVTLHSQGNQTMINVSMFSGPQNLRPKLELRPGADCNGPTMASTRPIILNPVNTGQVSQTFVSVPIESFKNNNFIVAVRDSTTQQQVLQACAQLKH
ncbi:MAG TPA: hypothetical protein VN905_04175 [Candidatus Binatia bacterium]|nr:hypothetical protein [Candidatus Binatia bacterium]